MSLLPLTSYLITSYLITSYLITSYLITSQEIMKLISFLYQWLVAIPLLVVITIVIALATSIGSILFDIGTSSCKDTNPIESGPHPYDCI